MASDHVILISVGDSFPKSVDAGRLEALYLPPQPAPAAYVCLGTMCSAPVTKPDALADAVRQMRNAGIRTLE